MTEADSSADETPNSADGTDAVAPGDATAAAPVDREATDESVEAQPAAAGAQDDVVRADADIPAADDSTEAQDSASADAVSDATLAEEGDGASEAEAEAEAEDEDEDEDEGTEAGADADARATAVLAATDVLPLVHVIEAALLVSPEPLTVERLQLLFGEDAPPREALQSALVTVAERCEDRAYELIKVASGYRFQVRQSLAPWMGRLYSERPARYSRALLETLALVAYRQPVTRGDIEEVRGVAVSTGIMRTLLERNWIHVVGYRDVPGRPALYGTTKSFLDYFNLSTLEQLPPLNEVRDLDQAGRELELALGLDPSPSDATRASGTQETAGEPSLIAALAPPEAPAGVADVGLDEQSDGTNDPAEAQAGDDAMRAASRDAAASEPASEPSGEPRAADDTATESN